MDLFNKKKLNEVEKERDYYERICEAKNQTITSLQEQISSLKKEITTKDSTINKLLDENKKSLEWIQKILEVCDTQQVNEPYKSITIPICKKRTPYKAIGDWDNREYAKTDIYIPAIHFSQVN